MLAGETLQAGGLYAWEASAPISWWHQNISVYDPTDDQNSITALLNASGLFQSLNVWIGQVAGNFDFIIQLVPKANIARVDVLTTCLNAVSSVGYALNSEALILAIDETSTDNLPVQTPLAYTPSIIGEAARLYPEALKDEVKAVAEAATSWTTVLFIGGAIWFFAIRKK